jgi:hypothetical protein
MSGIVFLSLTVWKLDGLENRNHMKIYENALEQLDRTPATDTSCLEFVGDNPVLFDYCRFENAGFQRTVAIIGDSHAHVLFPGFADEFKKRGLNTILLANSSCPPYLQLEEDDNCVSRKSQILDIVKYRNEIVGVVIATRSAIYITGTEPVSESKRILSKIFTKSKFNQAIIETISDIQSHKSVFLVLEVPELPFDASKCVLRPLRTSVQICSPSRESVELRRLNINIADFNRQNIMFLETTSIFCDSKLCRVFDEKNRLLYADDDHLSLEGSNYLARIAFNQDLLKNWINLLEQ